MIKKKIMDNNELFRAVVNSQSSMKSELLMEIGKLRKDTEKGFKEVNNRIDEHRKETKQGFININNRADLLGKQLNALDEDAPTGDEFKNLTDRIVKLENKYFVTA